MDLAEGATAAPADSISDSSAVLHDPREKWSSPYRGTEFLVSFRWLVTGALAYALLLMVLVAGNPDDARRLPFLGPSFYLTPVFGLPYVLATVGRPGRTRRLIYFLLLLPLVHMAAIYIAWDHGLSNYSFEPGQEAAHLLKSGAFGGVTGAVLAFTLLWMTGLTARPRTELVTMGFAAIVLGAVGAAAMMQAVRVSGGLATSLHASEPTIIGFELVHLPWQLVFAIALSWLMRPERAPKQRRERGA